MNKEFKPSKDIFKSKLLWILWPIILLTILYIGHAAHIWTRPHMIVYIFVGVLAFNSLMNAINLYNNTIQISGDYLVIVSCGNEDKPVRYRRDLIEHLIVADEKHWPFPTRKVLLFRYHELGGINYRVSDLSIEDQKEFLELLRNWFGPLEEIEL